MNLNNLKSYSLELLSKQHFDSLAVGVIDFNNNNFETFEIAATNVVSSKPYLYFDLASVTKPLVNSAIYLSQPEIFSPDMLLLLNHRAGLPAGGLLDKKNWKDQILSYDIKESETLYSDYSSLRCMLEIEKKTGKTIEELCHFYFDKELVHWKKIPENGFSPEYGMRNFKIISGEVHDNNCFNIGKFVSHAGLFSTINGLCQSLLNLNTKTQLCAQMNKAFDRGLDKNRFIHGFDHVTDLNNTLAGSGCSNRTFGHLGFVGTSFWIDLEKNRGSVILTNGVQTYWYDKAGLNDLRRRIGHEIWKL